jgi:phosphoglycerol transferase MdoB-like AlkP superfamily enzyme
MNKLFHALKKYYSINLPLLFLFLGLRCFEYFLTAKKFFFIDCPLCLELKGLYYDLWTWIFYCLLLLVPFASIYIVKPRIAILWQHFLNILFILIYISLIITFSERSTPFDHEFFVREGGDTWETIVNLATGTPLLLLIPILFIAVYFLLYFLMRKLEGKFESKRIGLYLCGINLFSLVFMANSIPKSDKFKIIAEYYLTTNKIMFFAIDSYEYFKDNKQDFPEDNNEPATADLSAFSDFLKQYDFEYSDSAYPLMHAEQSKDVLGNYFNLKKENPNIVFILVEGLSRNYSGDGAMVGSFTPFLDSLAKQSLYWENCLSSTLGSFGVLPSTLGALPYGEKGFTNLDKYPDHLSLIKILRNNGYLSYYFSGASLSFDNFGKFMRQQGTDYTLMDFGDYPKMPAGPNGIGSTGYADDVLFKRSLEVLNQFNKTPYISVYFTLSTHNPFMFEQKSMYDKLFENRISSMNIDPKIRETLHSAKNFLSSMLFADNCIREFINSYKSRPEYNNTIFIITGDHANGSVPTNNEIYYRHTPLIIFSPLLKQPEKFSCINTHNNIPQTLLALLNKNSLLSKFPDKVHWVGDVLDTAKEFRNIHTMPLVTRNYSVNNIIKNNWYCTGNSLYKIMPEMKLQQVRNDSVLNNLQKILKSYCLINNYVCQNNKLYDNVHTVKMTPVYSSKTYNENNVTNGSFSFLNFNIPKSFTGNLCYNLSFEIYCDSTKKSNLPLVVISLNDATGKGLYWGKKDIIADGQDKNNTWIRFNDDDIFNLENFDQSRNLSLNIYLWNPDKGHFKIRNVNMQLYYTSAASSGAEL